MPKEPINKIKQILNLEDNIEVIKKAVEVLLWVADEYDKDRVILSCGSKIFLQPNKKKITVAEEVRKLEL